MNVSPSSADFYTARQVAKKLGQSEARIRKLANLYGWEYRIVGSDKLFSIEDINRYILLRNYLNHMQDER